MLTDESKREQYDKYGEDGALSSTRALRFAFSEKLICAHVTGIKDGGHHHGGDPTSLFEAMFNGGGGGGGGGGRRGPQRGEDVVRKVPVDLKDLYKGRLLKIQVSRKRICGTCKGHGTKSGKAPPVCTTCNGEGYVVGTQRVGPGFVQRVRRECTDCKGLGVRVQKIDCCTACNGDKVVEQKAMLDAYVTPGMETGHKITFRGEADEMPGVEAGDIVIVLQQRPHARFERDGDDLRTTVSVPLVEALGGAVLQIEALDGRELRVAVPPTRVLRPFEVIVVKNEGS